MKRQSLTFTVETTEEDNGTKVWVKTQRCSRMRPLIITRAIRDKGYAITHVMSGKKLGANFDKLAQARKVLSAILPLTNWKHESETYYHDNWLRDKVRAIREESGV